MFLAIEVRVGYEIISDIAIGFPIEANEMCSYYQVIETGSDWETIELACTNTQYGTLLTIQQLSLFPSSLEVFEVTFWPDPGSA